MRYNPNYAPNVYRLIGVELIGIFLMLPSFFQSKFCSNVENTLRSRQKTLHTRDIS